MAPKHLFLFGGHQKWNAEDWTASDDRVRGGQSQSYLDINSSESIAHFRGTLDIQTLGGAGFASQRTANDDLSWNLSKYDGIELSIAKADKKRYTFILKNDIPAKRTDGREQSSISWEYDFTVSAASSAGDCTSSCAVAGHSSKIFIPWTALKATYRGKPRPDAPDLSRKRIRRFSIMNRSFFGDQEGKFSLELESIAAVQNDCGYEELAASMTEKSGHLDIERGDAVDEKTPLTGSRWEVEEAHEISVHEGRRVRTAVARMIVYCAMVAIVVHATMALRCSSPG